MPQEVILFEVIAKIYEVIHYSADWHFSNIYIFDPSFQMEKLKALDKKTPHETSWVPIVWAINLLTSADNSDKHSLRIESPVFANLLKGIDKIEANNRKLLNYGWVNFPLAYTQVIIPFYFWNYLCSHICRYDDKNIENCFQIFSSPGSYNSSSHILCVGLARKTIPYSKWH